MTRTTLHSIVGLACLTWVIPMHAQPVMNLDPSQLINDYIAIGEFNKDGDQEGWGVNAAAVTASVANGVFKVTTTSGDPWFFHTGLQDVPPEFTTVQVRLRVLKGERTGWEMFWGQTGATGFSGGRRIGYALDFSDTEFHVLEFDMSPVLEGGSLTDFRIDPGQNAGNVLEVDWVRVGTISADSDSDGLPDTVETGTGVYVGPRDTGTKPNQSDSDGDGVSDGVEVTYGTDPNDAKVFPVPSIDRYSENPAVYIVSVPIDANTPAVSNGTPTAFAVSPALPQGLNLDTKTGQISGTPASASPAADYSITATFPGNKTAVFVLRLEVRSPYVDFTVPKRAFRKDAAIAPFSPDVHGPAPQSYSIQPNLPDGLALDPSTGEISGTPTSFTKPTAFTLTATYAGSPAASAALEITVLEDPAETLDPASKVIEYFSLGEFDDPADATAFYRNNIDPLTVDNGIAAVVTNGGDPYFGRGSLALENDYKVLEFRLRFTDASAPLRLYWSEDAPGRGMSETTAWSLPDVASDTEFHVYQVDFSKATVGVFNAMRIDPGDGPGISLEVDYIRLGSLTAIPRLHISVQAGGKLRLSWPAGASGSLQSTTALPGGWSPDSSSVLTAGDEKYAEVQPSGSARFYRLSN